MSRMVITGGQRLEGDVNIHGAKNSVLPILAASVLNGNKNIIHGCPNLKDVRATIEILKHLGILVIWENDTLIVDSSTMNNHCIPEKLMREMRSSIIFLGAILSRARQAEMTPPGGCELGLRPIDLHLKAFKQLGVDILDSHPLLYCKLDKVVPCQVDLSFPSVGATENIMLLAAVSDGLTTISNAAREPEIVDLQNFLNSMGANITGAGSANITINGVKKLGQVEHTVIPDRIVASTFLAAVAMTGGRVRVTNIVPSHISSVLSVLRECGCELSITRNEIEISRTHPLKPVDIIRTLPYPGFPTDSQPQIMTVLSVANGVSIFIENIFENRFKHIEELNRMGGDIIVDGRVAIIKGVHKLRGAKVSAMDLRGAASLVIAGLGAEGITEVSQLSHLDRGYEGFEAKLYNLGANIKRMD